MGIQPKSSPINKVGKKKRRKAGFKWIHTQLFFPSLFENVDSGYAGSGYASIRSSFLSLPPPLSPQKILQVE